MTPMLEKIQPQWVLVDGEIHHVSDFAHLRDSKRPITYCLVCNRPVTLKLGTERVHHYAHRPDEVCAVNKPETALHLNLKYYLYNQLKQASTLYIEQRCSGGWCGSHRLLTWMSGWDEVKVEHQIGRFRADIGLLSKGNTLAAIEVLVTHEVSEIKAEYLKDVNVPWMEVWALEYLYEGQGAWKPNSPLPWFKLSTPLDTYVCEKCIKRKELLEKEKEEKITFGVHAAKMVDFYFPTGKKYREVLYLMKRERNGVRYNVWLKNRKNEPIAREYGNPVTESQFKKLAEAAEVYLLEKTRNPRVIMDVVQPWQVWERGKKFAPSWFDKYPYRYFWSEEDRVWLPQK